MSDYTTIAELFEDAIIAHRDRDAFGFGPDFRLTFDQVARAVSRVRSKLANDGVSRGDRVALYSENMPAWPVVYFAAATYPAVIVPILPDFTADDVENIVAHSGTSILVVSRRAAERVSDRVSTSFPQVKIYILEELLEWALDVSADQDVSFPASGGASDTADGSSNPVYGRGPAGSAERDELAAIIYTSGTTGHSKGVMLTHKNIASNVSAAQPIPRMVPGEHMLSVLPLSHTYECTLGFLIPFSCGVTVHYLSKPASPTVLLKALAEIRPHVMLSVPLLIEKVVRNKVFAELKKKSITRALSAFPPTRKLLYGLAGKKLYRSFGGRLHFFGIGGAPLGPDVEDFLIAARFPYAIGYGLTETAPLLAGIGPEGTRRASTGPVLTGVEIRIQDGEIQARGPNVMKGYYKNDELTAEVFTADGWFRTGDLGEFDNDGYLYIKGRSKSVILGPSGENIYPEAIEAIINEEELVQESLVVQAKGQLVALVHLNMDAIAARFGKIQEGARDAQQQIAQQLDSIKTSVNKRLSNFSRISRVEHQEEPFAKTPTQKIKRYLYQKFPGLKKE